MFKFRFTFCCLMMMCKVFAQTSPHLVETSVSNTTSFQFCDTDADGFTTIDIESIKNIIVSKHPELSNQAETIYLTNGFGKITKVENVSTTLTTSIVCPSLVNASGIIDIGVNSYGQIFVSAFGATYKTNNCGFVEEYPFGGNALSFDPNNNMYLPGPGGNKVIRSNGTDYNTFSVWHEFPPNGSPAGDFVYLNGKIYIAWSEFGTENIFTKLYEVTVDSNYNYISHVDLGELPQATFGLASELGKLYGSTPDELFRIDLPSLNLTTVYTNPGTDIDGWSGASSLHESGSGANAFETQANANNNINPLPNTWTNTIAGGQTIYVSIYDGVTDTYHIFPVQVMVITPQAVQPPDMEMCGNNLATFNLSNQDAAVLNGQAGYTVSYHLTQGDADAGINPLPANYQNISNPQTIYVRMTGNSDATCFDTTSFQLIVTPGTELQMPATVAICNGQEAVIEAPDGFASYSWSTGEQTQNITVDTVGEVILTVTDVSGCQASATIVVSALACEIPKGVSPNDDGYNDTFDLTDFDIRHLKIFNRYGMTVFEKENYSDQWHGQSSNGKELPSGTYYYLVKLTSGELKSGWVYLIQKG